MYKPYKQKRTLKISSRISNEQPERILHRKICSYLKDNYPEVYFVSDPCGLHTSWGVKQIILQTNSEHKHLDLVILHRDILGFYCGLILEIKSECPFTISGEPKSQHIKEQKKTMENLIEEKYCGYFIWDYDEAIHLIGWYLGEPKASNDPLL